MKVPFQKQQDVETFLRFLLLAWCFIELLFSTGLAQFPAVVAQTHVVAGFGPWMYMDLHVVLTILHALCSSSIISKAQIGQFGKFLPGMETSPLFLTEIISVSARGTFRRIKAAEGAAVVQLAACCSHCWFDAESSRWKCKCSSC